ncbi:MAG TPA: hypothetical protein VFT04_09060 [Gemmatimonadales bacterium]|nr:hypothetical protein [Gemmatimonadales bacterium]
MAESNDPAEVPEPPDSPGGDADPMAMLAFLQRLVATMSSGGDVDALMATAPPGFRELFADAERRVQAGETPDLGALLGMFGAGDDEEVDGDDDEAEPGEETGE